MKRRKKFLLRKKRRKFLLRKKRRKFLLRKKRQKRSRCQRCSQLRIQRKSYSQRKRWSGTKLR
jgi:hypothetical protein